MAHVSLNLQFWMPDEKVKAIQGGGHADITMLLWRLVDAEIDGAGDANMNYGDLKVKMDGDISDSNAT